MAEHRTPRVRSIDPWVPLGLELEPERLGTDSASQRLSATVFLAGAECPFRCVFCDLWQYTSAGPTPIGALPSQLSLALRRIDGQSVHTLKLYNASNFFDARAVPLEDDDALLDLSASYPQVTVECHPRLIGQRARTWSERLRDRGSKLEVALGLETVNQEALARMNKGAALDDYRRACEALLEMKARIRIFLLVGAPYIRRARQLEWIQSSVALAYEMGASVVTLIPVRHDPDGLLAKLEASRDFQLPGLDLLEAALVEVAHLAAERVLLVDLWDTEAMITGPEDTARVNRLRHWNESGVLVETSE